MIEINLTPKQNGSTVVRVIIMDGNIFNLLFSWVSTMNSGQRSQIQAMHYNEIFYLGSNNCFLSPIGMLWCNVIDN